MLLSLLKTAVEDRKLLFFDYDGQPRLVEPHAFGTNKKGQLILRGFQVLGGSATTATGWKLFTLEKATNLIVTGELGTSQAPRPGYKAGDKAMVEIFAQLPEPAPEVLAA
jgi:hypothetical protein